MIVRSFLPTLALQAALVLGAFCSTADAAVSAREVTAAVNRFLQQHSEGLRQLYGDAVTIETAVDRIDNRLSMADCDQPLATELRSQRDIGRINVQVSCQGQSPWTLYIPAEVKLLQEVVVLAEPVGRGSALTAANLTLRQMDVAQLNGGFYTAIDDVVGLVSRRLLSAGKPLTEALLEPPVVVHRGDTVVLTASGNGLTVKMPGTALSDGQAGQQISVRNSQSDRVVEGKVTGPGQVQVTM